MRKLLSFDFMSMIDPYMQYTYISIILSICVGKEKHSQSFSCMYMCIYWKSIYLYISMAICQLTNHTYICGLKLTNSLVLWINHCIKNVLPDSNGKRHQQPNRTLNIYWGVEQHSSKQAKYQNKKCHYFFLYHFVQFTIWKKRST